jgi:hypothetical protein
MVSVQQIPLLTSFLAVCVTLAGLVVNLVQFVLYITVRPFNLNLFRYLNGHVVEALWLCMLVEDASPRLFSYLICC